MKKRRLFNVLVSRLQDVPGVVLLGPRQCGKTTLAFEVAKNIPSVYLDMESNEDRARLSEPELYLGLHRDKLVIIDEIHRVPGLFPVLRGIIDQNRRDGIRTGMYLLLGSAALDMLRQSGETLAGRVSYLELDAFDITEIAGDENSSERLWLRGGFPESYLAPDNGKSLKWRTDFIRSYLERDIPQLGPRIPAEVMRRFWTMLAHNQGCLLNTASLARSMGLDVKTVSGYIELLTDLLLVRRLPPWHANTGKRLVRSPKTYLRDSGLVHALLNIADMDELMAHPVCGTSWEGFVIQQILSVIPETAEPFFLQNLGRSGDRSVPDSAGWFEVGDRSKRSLAPKPGRGFYNACLDLLPDKKLVVYPGSFEYPIGNDVTVTSLEHACDLLGE